MRVIHDAGCVSLSLDCNRKKPYICDDYNAIVTDVVTMPVYVVCTLSKTAADSLF